MSGRPPGRKRLLFTGDDPFSWPETSQLYRTLRFFEVMLAAIKTITPYGEKSLLELPNPLIFFSPAGRRIQNPEPDSTTITGLFAIS